MILSSQEMEFLFPVLRSQPKVDTLTGHFPFLGSWFFSLSHQFTFKFPALRRGRESLLPTPFPEYTHTHFVWMGLFSLPSPQLQDRPHVSSQSVRKVRLSFLEHGDLKFLAKSAVNSNECLSSFIQHFSVFVVGAFRFSGLLYCPAMKAKVIFLICHFTHNRRTNAAQSQSP